MIRQAIAFAAFWLASTLGQAAEVAVLKSGDSPAWRPAIEALRRSATGHTITEYDLKDDKAEALRVLAELKPKAPILVAMGPLAAQSARESTPDLPMIFCMIQDPGQLGLLGGVNTLGVAFSVPVKNQLAAFRAVNPRGVRIGVIFGSDATARLVQEAMLASHVLRLNLIEKRVASEKDVPATLRGMLKGPEAVDALWLPPDPMLLGDAARRFLLSETLKAGKPLYAFSAALVAEGALVSNGPDVASVGEQVAELVNRVAAGERGGRGGRGELLVPRGELVINKRMAERLKLEIPADALAQASRVF